MDTSVLSPEEEPNPGENKTDADESEQHEEAGVVDIVGVNGAFCRIGLVIAAGECPGEQASGLDNRTFSRAEDGCVLGGR